MLGASGLSEEIFVIAADFDSKEIVRVVTHMPDGLQKTTSHVLTDAEVEYLTTLREWTWSHWTELGGRPGVVEEWEESLYLLDAKDVTLIRAPGGFRETGAAGPLVHRLKLLAP